MILAPFAPPEVQTAGVVVLNVTARCEEAIAPTVKGDWTIVLLARKPKAIAWFTFVTARLRLTEGAGPYVPLPA